MIDDGIEADRYLAGIPPQPQTDPHYNDLIPFHQFIDGDNGRGGESSHQTGDRVAGEAAHAEGRLIKHWR
jgi:hypothetical protein